MSSIKFEEFKSLTENLPPPLVDMTSTVCGPVVEYDVKNGNCVGIGLFNNGKVAVQRALASANTIFPEHEHDTHEYLIIYEGHIIYSAGDEVVDLRPGDHVHILPDTPHIVKAVVDSWLIGITVPAEEGYPNELSRRERLEQVE